MRGEIEHLSEDEAANLMISAWEMQRVHGKIIDFMGGQSLLTLNNIVKRRSTGQIAAT